MPQATNEFPMPANLRPPVAPTTPPAGQPTSSTPSSTNLASALRSFAGQETFRLDPDLRLALEDQCMAAEGSRWRERWPEWLNQMVNDGLRDLLGR